MNQLVLLADQTPGRVTFENFEEVRRNLLIYVQGRYSVAEYSEIGLSAAIEDRDTLKEMRDVVTDKKKELEKAYSAPYVTVEKMLDELISIIDEPYKRAKNYVDEVEKSQKQQEILAFAHKTAEEFGNVGSKIVESADSQVLLARYFETLSMDGVKSFLETLNETNIEADPSSVPSENNVLGYKILKITATEDQMASILDQLSLMDVDVEEIEDGMPKSMKELVVPNFDSFVAFDIETTGSNGAANGDGEAKITEIGAVRVVNGEVVERFDELANPGRKIVPRIERLTHITNEMVADKPSVDEVIRQFYEFVGDNILVGHNIKSSDLRYITKAADKAGVHFQSSFLDTYLLAKKYKDLKAWDKVNLSYLSNYYGFEHKEAHRAWSDAEVNALIYFELQKLFMN